MCDTPEEKKDPPSPKSKGLKGLSFLFFGALHFRMHLFHRWGEVASTAIRHAPRVFKLAPLVVAAPARLSGGRKRMRHLECAVGIFVESLRRVFCNRSGEPAAPLGPFLGERLELCSLAPFRHGNVTEIGAGDRFYDLIFGILRSVIRERRLLIPKEYILYDGIGRRPQFLIHAARYQKYGTGRSIQ